jgi:hypothetical protein
VNQAWISQVMSAGNFSVIALFFIPAIYSTLPYPWHPDSENLKKGPVKGEGARKNSHKNIT